MRPLPARLYSALYAPAAPAIFAYLASRADSRKRWRDYLGANRFDGAPPARGALWVHAVSAGEVLAVAPLAAALRAALNAHEPATLTTTIQDALDVAERRAASTFPSRTFLPLDLPRFLEPFLERLDPRLLLLSETDVWPNTLLELRRRQVPAYLVNGRISPGAGRGYALARHLFAPALAAVRLFFVQQDADCERLLAAGVPEDRLRVRPNTKYERAGGPPPPDNPAAAWLRAGGRRVLLAGSTHEGEERLLLEAAAPLCGWLRVLAPRNPSRAAQLLALSPRSVRWSERSAGGPPPGCDLVVIDTMGELDSLYAGADLVFVGGTLGRWHGHNFLEPAWHSKAIVCGPDLANFAADAATFLREGALMQVADATELGAALAELAACPAAATAMGVRARELVEAGQGVSARIASEIALDLLALEADRVSPLTTPRSRKCQRPLRVLMPVGSAGLGGGERHAVILAHQLREDGLADVTLACCPGGWLEAQARRLELPVRPLSLRQGPDPAAIACLAATLCADGFDLLHTHLNWASLAGSLAARLAGLPCVATVHGLSRPGYYRFASRLIAVSRAVLDHLAAGLPAGPPADLVYTGLPPIPAADPAHVERLRARLGLSPQDVVFTVVGKLHPNKNQRLVLEAARLLAAGAPWRLLFVGAGPEEPSLRAVATLLGDRAVFAGELDDSAAVLALTSLLVVPSFKEAFGLAALEAQMAGVPVAAARTGGLLELVEDGVTGRLFDPGDSAGLAAILADQLANPAEHSVLAARARDSAARFTPTAMARATAEVYRSVRDQLRPRPRTAAG
ncbi:MAG: glycosyltransferase [Candidatus Wallbacteria bacterium]|nr:glycosyltransferase [Candidatus Wallbacteria bacterium]